MVIAGPSHVVRGTITSVSVYGDLWHAFWEPTETRLDVVVMLLRQENEGVNWMRGAGPDIEQALLAAHALWINQ
jgi:type II secretory pathway component PulM